MNENTQIVQELIKKQGYLLLHLKGVLDYTQLQKPKST